MKIYLLSDLHVEFHGNYHMPNTPVDVIVLAGDIDVGIGMLKVAERYATYCKVPVIVVAGNHEYYNSDYLALLPAFRKRAAEIEGVHFLENDSVVINSTRFLGCTLWSNFAFNGENQSAEAKATARRYIADFSVIKYGDRRFTPDDACAEFEASYRWLDSELAKPFGGDTVVVTHFLPHGAGVHPMYRQGVGSDDLTSYFTVDLDHLMRKHHITCWLYGHTHNSVDVTLNNGTRLVSNQRGYPMEKWTYTRYDSDKIIEIKTTPQKRARLDAARRFNALLEQNDGAYTTLEVAELLKLPERIIHRMIREKELLAYRNGSYLSLPVAQFESSSHQPLGGLRQVLLGFPDGTSARTKVQFCLTFFEETGKTPLQLLSEGFDSDRLAQAAAVYMTRNS